MAPKVCTMLDNSFGAARQAWRLRTLGRASALCERVCGSRRDLFRRDYRSSGAEYPRFSAIAAPLPARGGGTRPCRPCSRQGRRRDTPPQRAVQHEHVLTRTAGAPRSPVAMTPPATVAPSMALTRTKLPVSGRSRKRSSASGAAEQDAAIGDVRSCHRHARHERRASRNRPARRRSCWSRA